MIYSIRIPAPHPEERFGPEYKRIYHIFRSNRVRRKPKFWEFWRPGEYQLCRQGFAIAAIKKGDTYYNVITKQPILLNLKQATITPLWSNLQEVN